VAAAESTAAVVCWPLHQFGQSHAVVPPLGSMGVGSAVMATPSVEDISTYTASDLHVCNAHSHSVQAFLMRDYLD